MCQLATGHPADGMDEIPPVQIFKPVLIRIVCIGTVIKLVSRRVFHPVFITSILEGCQNMCNNGDQGTYSVFLFIEHEGSNGLTLIGARPSLSTNADGSTANAKMVNGARDSTRRRHLIGVVIESQPRWLMKGNNQPMVFLISLPS